MRIGVHLGLAVPQSGGQFTFQAAVSQALAEVARESPHRFVVFGSANVLMPPTDGIEVIPMRRSRIKRAGAHLYRTVADAARTVLGMDTTEPYNLEAGSILESGVDMVWYAGHSCFTMEIPYVFTLLDLQHLVQPYFPEVSNKSVWYRRERRNGVVLRRAARIIISTKVGKAEIERFYQVPGDRIVVLPYAAPAIEPRPADAPDGVLARYRIPPDYLFYPGQFWPQKNHVGLLLAVKALKDKWGMSPPVVFVGSDKGNLRYVKDWIVRLGLEDQVHILGFVPRNDLLDLYRHASVLTMPTLVGPDNIPSLEAMALECPVITSNLAGFDEQLGDAALLVNPRDEIEIAAAIKSVLEDGALRARLVTRGRAWVNRWTWRDYVRGVLKVFDEFEPIRRCWPPGASRLGPD